MSALRALTGDELEGLPIPPDPELEELAAEAVAAGFEGMTPPTPDELAAHVARIAEGHRIRDVRELELSRPLTSDEEAMLAEVDEARRERERGLAGFLEPEDRGLAVLSELGGVEYVEDLIRPGRIVVAAAEEGTGKSYAITGELGIRVATAGGAFAGTWPVIAQGPVLALSEMHGDDDFGREAEILAALELTRDDLVGRYWRLPLFTAAGDRPALLADDWLAWITSWMRDRGVLLLIVDTATGASQVDPWGKDIQGVYRRLRALLTAHPALAIVLIVHLKKPQGNGERRLSDVLGEWGRWCDVVLLLEHDGTRTKLSTRKRIRRERRIAATKAGGLLVDPVDLDETAGTKVAPDVVLAAIEADPGLGYVDLALVLGVGKSTAMRYVQALGDRVDVAPTGPKGAIRLYGTKPPPHSEPRTGGAVDGALVEQSPNQRTTPYIGGAVGGAVLGGGAAVTADPSWMAASLEDDDGYGPGATDPDPEPAA